MTNLWHPLDGARERLKRAEQNIQHFNREIADFLAPVPVVALDVDLVAGQPIITDNDREAFEKLTDFLKNGSIQPRFKVLAGEIIHHLRSAFDHLAWQLSSPNMQAQSPHQIEFPVFDRRPPACGKQCGVAKGKLCRYCRKVEGITSATARARIESLQPYHRANALRDSLWIIHDMDRIDKHRELVLAVYIMQLKISASAQIPGVGGQMPWEASPRYVRVVGLPTNVDMKVKMSPQISLGEFNKRDDEPIIPMLHNLLRFTTDSIEAFAGEFP